MSLSSDPEIAEARAPMAGAMAGAMAEATPPGVGDIAGRRALGTDHYGPP